MAMAAATSIANKKYMTNYARLGHAAQELLPDMLRELMLLKEPTNKLIQDCYANNYLKNALKPIEWFCINNVTNNEYSKFDVPLLYKLIRNLNIVPQPTANWDYPRDPMGNELTVGDDVERIRRKRNEILHKASVNVDDTELSENFSLFKGVASRLEAYMGKPNGYFGRKCEWLETCCMDSQAEEQFLQKMKEFAENEKDVQDVVRKVQTDIELLKVKDNTTDQMREEHYRLMVAEMNEMKEMMKTMKNNMIHMTSDTHTTNRDLIDSYILEWEKDEETFVMTRATKFVLDNISTESCIAVVGCPGSGKSAIIHQVALHLRKTLQYEIIPSITEPSDLKQYYNSSKKQIFILDDVFGSITVNGPVVDKWALNLEMIERIISLGKTKVLISCRLQIIKDPLLCRLKILTANQLNLHSEKLCLIKEERLAIAQKYLEKSDIGHISDFLETYAFFPLLCKYFSKNVNSDPRQFFQNPVEVMKKHIIDMKKETNRTQYCAFTLCVLFNNKLKDSWLERDAENDNVIRRVCEDIGLELNINRRNLQQQLHNLENTNVHKSDGSYSIIHDKIFDVAGAICGQDLLECFIKNADATFIGDRYHMEFLTTKCNENYIIHVPESHEKMYFVRLMTDLDRGNTYSTFQNRQLQFTQYREKLIAFISTNRNITEEIILTFDQRRNIEDKQREEECYYSSTSDDDDTFEQSSCTIHPEDIDKDIPLPLLESSSQGFTDIVNMLINMGCNVNIRDSFGRSAMYVAALHGHIATVKYLLQHRSDVLQCDRWGRSSLYIACEEGHAEVVQLLLTDSDVSKCDTCYFKSPLHVACEKGHASIVKMLLENGSNLDQCNSDGHSPLYVACSSGYPKLVKLLIGFGSDINQTDEKDSTPLYISCKNGHSKVVKLLLGKRADVSLCDSDGLSPLHISCKWGHTAVVEILLESNAEMDTLDRLYGRTPLFLACEGKHEDIIQLLIGKGCNINHCNKRKQSPLYIACKTGQTNVVKLFLQQMTDHYVLSFNYCDWSPLIAACEVGNACIVQMLLDRNFYINIRNENDQRPLHIACKLGQSDIVKVLLRYECDLNLLDGQGLSPLFIACEEGFAVIVKLLLENNAELQTNENGWSPFFIACLEGHADVVELLFQYQSETWECDNDTMRSPLFVACKEGNIDVVDLLLQNKANVNQVDISKWSPLHIASKEGHTDVVKLLLKSGADATLCTNSGRRPVDLARSSFRDSVVKLLELEYP